MVRTGLDYHTAAGRVIQLAGELLDASADLRDVARRQTTPTILGPVGAGYAARMAAVTAWLLQDWRKAEPNSFAMHPSHAGLAWQLHKAGQPAQERTRAKMKIDPRDPGAGRALRDMEAQARQMREYRLRVLEEQIDMDRQRAAAKRQAEERARLARVAERERQAAAKREEARKLAEAVALVAKAVAPQARPAGARRETPKAPRIERRAFDRNGELYRNLEDA